MKSPYKNKNQYHSFYMNSNVFIMIFDDNYLIKYIPKLLIKSIKFVVFFHMIHFYNILALN